MSLGAIACGQPKAAERDVLSDQAPVVGARETRLGQPPSS